MRTYFLLALGAVALAAVPAGSRDRLTPEAALAHAIEGRVAGKPVDCLQQRDIRSTQIIDGTAIVYETNGRKLYVNRPASGGSFLRSDDVMVTDTHSSQLCSIDIVRLFDNGIHMERGSIGLGKFVPYTKVDKDVPVRG